ncbi:MAG TPA: TRIC cation channel family protein, partial [Intrasporangiaceae bacterium]|nr:TRIC cation channel family protein [Intrasporangiaceae bacterium]
MSTSVAPRRPSACWSRRRWASESPPSPVAMSPTPVQTALDLVGVFAFALSGGLVALRAQLDLFGVLVLAWVTGLGGGIIRDLLLGATPPVGISDWRLVSAGLVAGVVVFACYGRFRAVAAR